MVIGRRNERFCVLHSNDIYKVESLKPDISIDFEVFTNEFEISNRNRVNIYIIQSVSAN